MTPCAYANEGTALKPAIEFDSRLEENVGLKFKVDLAYVKEHADPSAEGLRDNMITEAIVSSLTTLDNKPCAVDYAAQKEKTGETMARAFECHIREVQICESCQERTPSQRNILKLEQVKCESFCNFRYDTKDVCEDCKGKGHISYLPSMRCCDFCLANGLVCNGCLSFVDRL